ncbi:hypothetical protein D8674_014290 [Pyrus ussuriensis x Pyrus communis]|uniref:Uncharacterized protein n=1 Tax=Pyrus ussuriensis x Pyrus communis TaxID=2448454 RepID=A0A5N5GWZ2_9ROSA|nr:hypothetical protein D8674_014290 [Pyrus ussuriensis x Pyrus communis]
MHPNQNQDLRVLHKINPPRAKSTITTPARKVTKRNKGRGRAKRVCKTPLFRRESFHTSFIFSSKLDR